MCCPHVNLDFEVIGCQHAEKAYCVRNYLSLHGLTFGSMQEKGSKDCGCVCCPLLRQSALLPGLGWEELFYFNFSFVFQRKRAEHHAPHSDLTAHASLSVLSGWIKPESVHHLPPKGYNKISSPDEFFPLV